MRASLEVRRQIAGALRVFRAAWNRHDAGAMAMAFSRQGDLLNSRGRYARGRSAIARLLALEHGAGQMHATTARFQVLRLRLIAGSLAVGDFEMTIGGAPVRHLRVLIVFRRESEGWRFLTVRPHPI